ncbi:MAG: PepSY domain-containing protein [Treponema sp.]|nr:PepSY domain-containing protein [Treponema sp.]
MKKVLTGIFAVAFLAAGHALYAQAVSAPDAMERALAITGGGTVESLELVSDPAAGQVFRIMVVNNAIRYEALVNASTGEVLGLRTIGDPGALPGSAVTSHGVDLTALGITPAAPPRFSLFRPRNPPVSRANAVEIGYLFLASQGFPHATFRRHSGTDRDHGRWAWELYFLDGWTEIELYIDMHSGEVVKFDIDR